jgi:hyperosmotically inducible protein
MKINQVIAGFLLIGAACFTSCRSKDVELKSNVSEAVRSDKVEVSVKDGVVTLTGEVPGPAAKAKAEAEARKVNGVHSVVNEITIPLPPPPPVPGHGLPSADEKLTGEVRAVIAPFPDVSASVNDGVVTLTGTISRPGLVLMMPRIAGLFPKKIENKLVIK